MKEASLPVQMLGRKAAAAFIFNPVKMWSVCRQESYFHYLFGVEEEDYYGALDLRDGRTMLFMPRLPESYAVSFYALQIYVHNVLHAALGVIQLCVESSWYYMHQTA